VGDGGELGDESGAGDWSDSDGQPAVRRGARDRRKPGEFWKVGAALALLRDGPRSFAEAMASPDSDLWKAACDKEMDAHKQNGTWELVDLPSGRKAIGNKWVMRVQLNPDGSERYKSRFCAQGFSQKAGIDYKETFAPVVRVDSLRLICAIAAVKDLELEHVDVDTAFLHGDLDEEIYMRQPPGYISKDAPAKVCLLKRSLYGLKQAQHVYNQKWNKTLSERGYTQGRADHCVHTLTRKGLQPPVVRGKKAVPDVIVGTYVDDSVIAGTPKGVAAVKADIQCVFPIKDHGPVQTIVGIEVRRDRNVRTIHLSQKRHVNELLERARMQDCHPASTPLALGTRLSNEMSPTTDAEKKEMEGVPYSAIVGSLLYLATGTRPDISYAVGEVCRFMKNPGMEHWKAVKHILRYLKGTADMGLLYGGPEATLSVVGYADADWAGDVDSRRSTAGYVFMVAGGPVAWRSKRQATVALSTMEAEYMSLCAASQEAAWLQRLMEDVCGHDEGSAKPMVINEDNNGAKAFSKKETYHGRAKHIDTKYHFVREQVRMGAVEIVTCKSDDMLADILTKMVARDRFEDFVLRMGMRA
jgi:hypothetical protein